MNTYLTIAAELIGVALVSVGTYLVAGFGAALIVAGALLLVGIELYGLPPEPETEEDETTIDPQWSVTTDARKIG